MLTAAFAAVFLYAIFPVQAYFFKTGLLVRIHERPYYNNVSKNKN